MKNLIKKTFGAVIMGVMMTVSISSVFADTYVPNINAQICTKDSSYIENINGKVECKNKSNISIENEKSGSVTAKKVNINKQEISGSGEVVISNNNKTDYKNVKAYTIIDLDLDINTPVIHNKDIDLTIENKSETNFENVEAGRIYKFNYTYNNPIKLPY